ncbi:MAG: type II secretion system GspH family protein [bacterium]|nr:type II secretion system GspH family protein [bacterium]
MKKGFTLVEIIVSIGVIGLVIVSLLLVIYNIQLMQSKQIFGQIVAKKAEFYIMKNILTIIENYRTHENPDSLKSLIESTILNGIETDNDLRDIKINNVSISIVPEENVRDIYLQNIAIYGNGNDYNLHNNKNIFKYYFSIDLDYLIIKSNKNSRTSIQIPLFLVKNLPHNPPSGGSESTGSETTSLESSYSF